MRRYSASVEKHASPVPLSQVETGTTARIAFITAGHGLTGRLCAMGLVAGEHLCVLQNARHGPVIVALDGCRIVLGRGMAEKILVE